MLRVIAQTAYPHSAASARVRLAGFVPFLAERGVELDYRPTLTDAQYAAVGRGTPIAQKLRALAASSAAVARTPAGAESALLLVHRLRSLVPVPGREFSPRIDVYDFDDAMFAGSGAGTGLIQGVLKAERRRWRRYVAAARLVVAGNEYLASAALRRTSRVEVVPSCVDPRQYQLRQHQDRAPATIGWLGSRSTSAFLEHVLPAFERFNRPRVRARLLVIGGGPLPSGPWLEQRPWSPDREAADLAEFDVGIMPLPDDPWTRGKCGYKALEYFAAGIPVIASPVGVNARLVGSERGRLASSIEDWYGALEELTSDAALRQQMGAEGRRLVERDYSYQRWAPELAAMLESVAP